MDLSKCIEEMDISTARNIMGDLVNEIVNNDLVPGVGDTVKRGVHKAWWMIAQELTELSILRGLEDAKAGRLVSLDLAFLDEEESNGSI